MASANSGAVIGRAAVVSSGAVLASATPERVEETAATSAAGPRITSVGQTTWIRKRAEVRENDFLGYVRVGRSVTVKSLSTVPGLGCAGGFYEALPRGFICADRTVSTAPAELFMKVEGHAENQGGPLPFRYVLSDGAPMYNRVPSDAEIVRHERFLGSPHQFTPLIPTLRAHEELAVSDPIAATSPLPDFLDGGGALRSEPYDLLERIVPRGAMISYVESFDAGGRTWLLSTDHTLVPADRVRAYRASDFHGTKLGAAGASLPIAWMRKTAKPKFLVTGDEAHPRGEWAVRTFVELTGGAISIGKKRYLETKERLDGAPLFLDAADATIADVTSERPLGVKAGQKWISISITAGTLVAYEDMLPVYATLVSPGAGGVPIKGHNPIKDSTTPLGTYTITFKDRAATMSPESSGETSGSDRKFWIADVPHTQYFDPPFALHAAFWHERFGEPVSAGCVNLSPIDAAILFDWTDPAVPEEWQGATGAGAAENGASTEVVIRR